MRLIAVAPGASSRALDAMCLCFIAVLMFLGGLLAVAGRVALLAYQCAEALVAPSMSNIEEETK